MATNVLMPLSPTGSSQGLGLAPSGGQLSGKYIRSAGHKNRGSRESTKDGSLTKKGQGTSLKNTNVVKETKVKKNAGAVVRDINSLRNSILHNICTEVLEKGFHKSFSELFQLVEQQRLEHARAGPAAILLEPLIENDHTKLEQLKVQLTTAEDARRAGDMDTVYMAQRKLAQYFEQSKDTWLSDHFYHRCLETGTMVEGDNRRKEGEAHCHVALALENRGDLSKASVHMETFHQLARKHKWHTDNGDSLHEIACEHLRRIYTKIAEQVHAESSKDSIIFLKKAHEFVKEGGDTYQEGLACYRLGNAHEGIGEHDVAIQYHKGYLERCKYHGDEAGVGSAYEALSRSFESKGDIENAVKFLEMYVSVSERAGLPKSLANACSAIGIMHNTLGNYDKAVDFFDRCYKICTELNDTEALHLARVHYGVARSHQLMGNFSSVVNEQTCNTLQQLVLWKDTRVVPSSEAIIEEQSESDHENENLTNCDDEQAMPTNIDSHSTENDV